MDKQEASEQDQSDSRSYRTRMIFTRALVILVIVGYVLLGFGQFPVTIINTWIAPFTFQMMLVAAGACVLLLLMRSPGWALMSLVLATINAFIASGDYRGRDVQVTGTSQELRVMLANVLYRNENPQYLNTLIVEEKPDVVIVQECTKRFADSLESLASTYPHQHAWPSDSPGGLAIISRHPMRDVTVGKLEKMSFPYATAVIDGPNADVLMFAVHLMSPRSIATAMLRNRELESIADLVATKKLGELPVILVGDMNTTMYSPRFRNFARTSGLVSGRRGFGNLPTWPVRFPKWFEFRLPSLAMIPIDHLCVDPVIMVNDFRLGPDIGSDHLPLVVDMRIPGTGGHQATSSD